MMKTVKVPSAQYAGYLEAVACSTQEEYGSPLHLQIGIDKMRAHERNSVHTNASQAALDAQLAMQQCSVLQQLQQSDRQERMKKRAAIKSFIRCTHFLTCQHIPHTTNFDRIVNLVISCGGEDLKHFLETTGRIALYTSHVAVVDFVEDGSKSPH